MSSLVLDFAVDPEVASRLRDRFPPETLRLRLDDLRRLGPWGTLRRLQGERFESCSVIVNDFRSQGRWLSLLAVAMLARASRRVLVDPSGAELPLTWRTLVGRELPFALRRAVVSARVSRRAWAEARRISPAHRTGAIRPRRVLFVRADLDPRLTAGGSLAHIRGVVGGLEQRGCEVTFVSPSPLLGFEESDERVHLVPPDERIGLSVDFRPLAYNFRLAPRVAAIARGRSADLVYHRHTLGGYAAAAAAQGCGLPLVVEFNGSEVWVAQHWGAGLKREALFVEIEHRALQAADLVVAVSEPLRAQLHAAGVSDERILVNPNGVDAERFAPDRFANRRAEIRRQLGVGPDEVLAGFVGTFGPWHGSEVLAEAAGRLREEAARKTRFVFVGDGPRRLRTETILEKAGLANRAVFLGLVPQDDTPAWLSACDVTVSPHVPNADGTPFFGSPTKLFEYMASGRAIVASRLDQIGEVLEHGRNAWLVAPGDPEALARAIEQLVADPTLRTRLGDAARSDAAVKHTWAGHVERILERLSERPGSPGERGAR